MAHQQLKLDTLSAHYHVLPKRRIISCACRIVGGARGRGRSAVVHSSSSSSSSSGTLPAWMVAKPADSRQSPFYELELMELCDGIGKTRVRQHVNPLRREFQLPTAAPHWPHVFTDPSLPLVLDIGCGYGRFLLLLQRNNPEQRVNYLGLEIRRTLVDRSNEWVSRLGLQGRVHYVFTNATVSLTTLLCSYPGPLTDVFIQFPDPHFKRRHRKRRVVQQQTVAALRDLMEPGGRLLLQSDVEEACVPMRNMFERYGSDAFALAPQHHQCQVFYSRPVGPPVSSPPAEAGAVPAEAGAVPAGTEAAAPAAAASSHAAEVRSESPLAAVLQPAAVQGPASAGYLASSSSAAPQPVAVAAEGSSDAERGGGGGGGGGGGLERGFVHAATAAGASPSDVAVSTDYDEGDGAADGGGSGGEDLDADISSMVSEWAKGGWLVDNPIGTPTEREHYVGQQGLPVYRVLLVRV